MVRLDFETTDETINLLNSILRQIIKQENNWLTSSQKDLIEKFRLKMVRPVVIESENPLSDAALMYFGDSPLKTRY